MDGLKIKEHNISEIINATDYFRLEADYFTSQNLQGEDIIFAQKYIKRVQYGTSEFLNEDKQGYPVLRLNEFEACFIKEPAKCCNLISQQQYQNLKLHKGDILICRTNGNPNLVGRAAVIMEDCNYAFASYLFRVNVNSDITPEAFVAYLQCKYGRVEIDKNSMKGNQTNFSPSKLKEVKMPCFSINLCSKITSCFEQSYNALKKAKESYASAEKLLEKEIGIDMSEITDGGVSVKSFIESFGTSGRLDAEYYQPKYEQIENAIKNGKFMTLSEISDIQTGEFIPETLYGNIGVSYIRGSEITSGVINIENSVCVNADISKFKTIEKGDLAFAMIGSVGNVSLNNEATAIVSNNLGTIKLHDKELSNYLLVYLLSDVGQALFEKYQTRTAQPKIKKEDVGNFLVPILPDVQIKYINSVVKESFALKKMSETLLELAIQTVEMAIETDEETAISWLESQKSKEI